MGGLVALVTVLAAAAVAGFRAASQAHSANAEADKIRQERRRILRERLEEKRRDRQRSSTTAGDVPLQPMVRKYIFVGADAPEGDEPVLRFVEDDRPRGKSREALVTEALVQRAKTT